MTMSDWTPHAQTSRVNPLARAAFVCGIVQFGFFFSKGIALLGIAAIILGHLAVRQIRRTGDGGYGLAKTGLILGYGVWAIALLGTLAVLAIGAGAPVSPSP
jgi:peptidyl-prolyl cis-trans isomerase B (cyclophilin B)